MEFKQRTEPAALKRIRKSRDIEALVLGGERKIVDGGEI
jgi:hypothetical protein